jgi:hypothetical protein
MLSGPCGQNRTAQADRESAECVRALGRTIDQAFPDDNAYQSSIERWNKVFDCYDQHKWSTKLFDLSRNVTPLTKAPWGVFRRVLAELREIRGHIDPAKDSHRTIFFDVLSSVFVLWAAMGRDIRRFYEPTMNKADFETVLRYYFWGGKESYNIRKQMRERLGGEGDTSVELPAWDNLLTFSGLIVSAPHSILDCAHVCRELSIRAITGPNAAFDTNLSGRLKNNSRIRQFCAGLNDYLVSAGKLPRELATRVQDDVFGA